ncbi:hypothetical protein vseg_003201 [Gypsophila vaccaria]
MSALIEGLPDAVALRCLAFVPYYLHLKLELVSRTWRAAIRSRELFKAREEVGYTEEFLCVCAFEPDNLWQLYDPLHDVWITIPVLPSKIRHLANFGAVSTGGKLFVLGGRSEAVDALTGDFDGSFATDEVWSYDPILRKWSQRVPMSLPRAVFACSVLNGKIIVASGFRSYPKSTAKAEVYDPENNTWDSIPDLPYNYISPCSGVVIDSKMHVVHRGISTVQVLENPSDGWMVKDCSWLQDPITVVEGVPYVMTGGLLYRQETEKRELVVSADEVVKRIGYKMIGLRGEIYVVGGVLGPNRSNPGINPTSDVDVLTVGSDHPVWHRATPMSRCRGTILGCTTLRI